MRRPSPLCCAVAALDAISFQNVALQDSGHAGKRPHQYHRVLVLKQKGEKKKTLMNAVSKTSRNATKGLRAGIRSQALFQEPLQGNEFLGHPLNDAPRMTSKLPVLPSSAAAPGQRHKSCLRTERLKAQ